MVGIRYQPGFAHLRSVAFCALAIALFALPIRVQKGGTGGSGASGGARGSPGGGMSGRSDLPPFQPGQPAKTESEVLIPTTQPMQKPAVAEDESCLPWELPDARGAT